MEIIYIQEDGFKCVIGCLDIDEPREFFFSLDSSLDDVEDFLRISGKDTVVLDSSYSSIRDHLGMSSSELFRSLPSDRRKDMCRRAVKSLSEAAISGASKVYLTSYKEQKEFLRKLKNPVYSDHKLKVLSEEIPHESTRRRVLDLLEDTQKTEYSMSGTVTGRLVVKKGPNILTLPSKVRSCIRSSYRRGKILQLDLTAAEPFLALLRSGKMPPKDIYSHISEEVLEGKVSRSDAKIITLSALYGQSSSNLSKKLPDSVNARDVISKTKRYFDFERLARELSRDLKNRNFRNVLGRPLFLDDPRESLLISYYLQSSIAECSILLFSDFYRKFENSMKPYYVIHDALIFDAEEKFATKLLEKESIALSLGEWKFRAKVSEV